MAAPLQVPTRTADGSGRTGAHGEHLTDDEIIDRILDFEGGYVDHPADGGGPTKFGITLATLKAWRGGRAGVAAEDVRALTREEARAIYRARYIADPGLDAVADPGLRLILVDCAVLYGPRRAVQWLQSALEMEPDGVLGAATLSALRRADPRAVGRAVLASRYLRIAARCVEQPSQKVFERGWLARTDALGVYC